MKKRLKKCIIYLPLFFVLIIALVFCFLVSRPNNNVNKESSEVSTKSIDSKAATTTADASTVKGVAYYFPSAKVLNKGQYYSSGSVEYQLVNIIDNYTDSKYCNTAYTNQGINNKNCANSFKVLNFKFYNPTSQKICVTTQLGCTNGADNIHAINFGCIYTLNDGYEDSANHNISNDVLYASDIFINGASGSGTNASNLNWSTDYPHSIDSTVLGQVDKTSQQVLNSDESINVTIEVSSMCKAVGDANGNSYWSI